ncbi:hypothetical protein [Legionella sp. km772]|uniref:hypothetical protein n=1 Tax=Legionella sp. km772 TaxID=2498111 RepID=UPI000F8F3B50|nr:hypothetical protein [Legionella sp. km772]RUR04987.1 hypothetical protein ELY15_14855 [Legionella sp. km772]
MNNLPNHLTHLINEARRSLQEMKLTLQELKRISSEGDDSSAEDQILTIQLLLQYRLSNEDALSMVLEMEHNILFFLGIQPQQSAQINRERLAYALGNEDLKQILNVLSILTGSLSKIINHYKSRHTSFALKHQEPPKHHRLLNEVSKLTTQQKQFSVVVQKLHLEIKQILKFQAAGPIFDHIAALRGPISQFHQALLHGLGQAKELYHQVNKTPIIDVRLNDLLKQAQIALQSLPSTYNPKPSSPQKEADSPNISDQLEQRAAAKRLRPFFG